MKKYIFIAIISIAYISFTACNNTKQETNSEKVHTHEHDENCNHDNSHQHQQEEFVVGTDSVVHTHDENCNHKHEGEEHKH